jgi:hypothetical protein
MSDTIQDRERQMGHIECDLEISRLRAALAEARSVVLIKTEEADCVREDWMELRKQLALEDDDLENIDGVRLLQQQVTQRAAIISQLREALTKLIWNERCPAWADKIIRAALQASTQEKS